MWSEQKAVACIFMTGIICLAIGICGYNLRMYSEAKLGVENGYTYQRDDAGNWCWVKSPATPVPTLTATGS